MIWESSVWKDYLLKSANELNKISKIESPEEIDLVNFEKEIFFSFYSIRKLIEARKISDIISNCTIPGYKYPIKGSKVTHHFNWYQIDDLYNLNQQTKQDFNLKFLCNQVIHSYVFMPKLNCDDKLESFYLVSGRLRNKRIHEFYIDQVIQVFKKVGDNYPSKIEATFNSSKQDFDIEI